MVKRIVRMIHWQKSLLVCLFLGICFCGFAQNELQVSIITDEAPGNPVRHGINKLTEVLTQKHIAFESVKNLATAKAKQVIIAGLTSGDGAAAVLLKQLHQTVPQTAEALTVAKTVLNGKQVLVTGGYDDQGLMYALLDIANRISWNDRPNISFDNIKAITEQPGVSERAISIYTMNRAYWETRFYNENYWVKYLDMLAQNRFNTLVLIFGYENGGFLAPCYPYFFNIDGFPDVNMVGLSPQEQQKNLDAFNRLITMAHDRGIRFTVGIWDHIYRGGVQGGGIPGTKDSPDKPVPGLVWGVNADNLIVYTKAALAKFVKVFPGLDGIQFRMHDESGLKNGEQDAFWLDIFKMLKTTAPNVRLDLRAKELKESIIQNAINVGINFKISTKYWMEQMGLPYHPTQINPEKSARRHSYSDLLHYPQQYKMHWQLWSGGTSRILLFGDPGYVRRFAETTHLYDGDGYEVNEPLATKMEAQPHDMAPFDLITPKYRYYDYEFERYWHFFQVFGRIGYNPYTSSDTWDKEFGKRFGTTAGPLLENALHKASWILPRIISSSYPYSSFPTTRGWAEKQRLGDLPAFAKAEVTDLMQFANADDEARLAIEGGGTPRLLPSANSKWFRQTADSILLIVSKAEKLIGDHPGNEFISTVTDLKILSGLALYHAARIPAAVSYRLFERTKDVRFLDDAIGYEKNAIDAWRGIVAAAGDVYANDLMMGVRVADLCGHWKDELAELEKGFSALQLQRKNYTATDVISAPQYKPAAASDNHLLFQIVHQPIVNAPVGKSITFKIKVTARAGIKSVNLRYRGVSQEETYKILPMLPSGEKNLYEATVPSSEINPRFDFMYLFEIMDNNNKGTIYPDVNKETPYRIINLIR